MVFIKAMAIVLIFPWNCLRNSAAIYLVRKWELSLTNWILCFLSMQRERHGLHRFHHSFSDIWHDAFQILSYIVNILILHNDSSFFARHIANSLSLFLVLLVSITSRWAHKSYFQFISLHRFYCFVYTFFRNDLDASFARILNVIQCFIIKSQVLFTKQLKILHHAA